MNSSTPLQTIWNAGIAYSPNLDEWLDTLWKRGVKPHLVVAEYRKRHSGSGAPPEPAKD